MLLLVKQAGSWPRFARGFPRVALGNSAGSRRCCVTSPGSRVGITELFDAGSALRWKRRYAAGSATLRHLQSLWFFRWFVSAGLKARVQRTVRVALARVGERVARTGRESRSTRERVAHWRVVLNSPIWTPAGRIRVSVWGGAPPMSMVSDDFGLRYLIFHSFRERYTQAFISVVTYIMMPKFNGHPHHLWLTMPASFRD